MNDKTLHLAVTMAGAVSAGSYTGGVMDYLLEALENWQQAKAANLPDVPTHQVQIDLLNGTSAGGMTAVIAAVALQEAFAPVKPGDIAARERNKLYRSWVDLTGQDNLLPDLLQTDDIQNDRVPALLNSAFIDAIAQKIVDEVRTSAPKRPYLAPNLEVMVTLTNLLGLRYKIFFGPNSQDAYEVCNHLDFGHFVFTDQPYQNDGRMVIDLKKEADREVLRQCAMATGAFPVGLAARKVKRSQQFIQDNPQINLNHPAPLNKFPLPPVYETVNVDGGLLNNEPFDRAEAMFQRRFGAAPSQTPDQLKDANSMRYSILMIDPFPSEDFDEDELSTADVAALRAVVAKYVSAATLLEQVEQTLRSFLVTNRALTEPQVAELLKIVQGTLTDSARQNALQTELLGWNHTVPNPETHLKALVGPIFSTMRQQLMFKKDDLQAAFDPHDYSRFLIAPKRVRQVIDAAGNPKEKKISGSKAIACGSFGGFGGFVSKSFREHDFFLGRMNCKRFLQKHFGVPVSALETNPLFQGCYSEAAIQRFAYVDPERLDAQGQPTRMVPLIPILDLTPEPDLPWPTLPEAVIRDLRKPFKQRSRAVMRALFHSDNWWWRQAVNAAAWAFDGNVADTVMDKITEDFRNHRLLVPTGDVSRDRNANVIASVPNPTERLEPIA
jgi:predicted acylesterase/phospholipase RssA